MHAMIFEFTQKRRDIKVSLVYLVLIFLYVKHKLWLIKALLMSCRQLLIIWRLCLKFLFLNITIMKRKVEHAHLFYDFTTESCKVPMFCKILRNLQTFLMLLIIFFFEICQILVAFNGMHEVYLKLVS